MTAQPIDPLLDDAYMARARMITGNWQERAACRGDWQFLDRPEPVRQAVCSSCPVAAACASFGLTQLPAYRDREIMARQFLCGHPREPENIIRNGRSRGRQTYACRACRRG